MGRTRRKRRNALALGVLVCVPVVLLATLPLAWRLADWHGSAEPFADNRHTSADAQVAWGTTVRINGTIRVALSPGVSAPIHLRFDNRTRDAVTLHSVKVNVTRISAPQADAVHPCTRADFRVRQMAVLTVLRIPARRVKGLVRLGIPLWQWPRLAMLNRAVNQDGCKGARLTLSYRAKGLQGR